MKKYLLIFLFSTIVYAKPYEPNQIDRQIISHTYNENFDQAKKLTQDQIKLFPSSPKYFYYMINARMMEYFQKVQELDPNKRDEGRKTLNQELISYCENVIEKFDVNKLNAEDKFYYGTIYAYLARLQGVDRSWFGAFKSGLKAKGIMEDVLKADKNFYDAYLVLGMLNYYADRLSGITSFVAGILGFSGDRDKGLQYLKLSYEKGIITFGQSALTLIEVYSNLEDNDYAALPYYESFLKQYPQNKRTLNIYCHELMDVWDYDKVDSIIKNDSQNLIEDYTKARYYDAIGNSALAVSFAENALKDEKKLWRGAEQNARYIVVYNSLVAGDWNKIKKYEGELNERYIEIFNLDKKYQSESKWLNSLGVMIVLKKPVKEIESYSQSKPNLKRAEGFEEQFNVLMGHAYFNINDYDKAELWFWKSVSTDNERAKAQSLKGLIEIYTRRNVNKSKVEKLLDAIDDWDSDRLKFRAKDLEKKYNI